MEPRESRFVLETLNVLRERYSGDEFNWEKFSNDIKAVLDSRFGTGWNVLIGKSVGYAMKARKKSSFVAIGSGGEIVICWKSPGFEVEDSDIVKMKAAIIVEERDSLLGDAPSNKRLNVVYQPSPDSTGYTPETPQGMSILTVCPI